MKERDQTDKGTKERDLAVKECHQAVKERDQTINIEAHTWHSYRCACATCICLSCTVVKHHHNITFHKILLCLGKTLGQQLSKLFERVLDHLLPILHPFLNGDLRNVLHAHCTRALPCSLSQLRLLRGHFGVLLATANDGRPQQRERQFRLVAFIRSVVLFYPPPSPNY